MIANRNVVKSLESKVDNINNRVEDRIRAIEERLNRLSEEKKNQANWFLAILTALIGSIMTVLLKDSFFN